MTITLLFTFFCLLAWRFQEKRTTYGSAAWLTIFEAMRKGLFRRKGILVGDWTGHLPVYYEGTHAITFGAAGSGKGTTAIIPNLLHYPHIYLNDPGGENTAVAIRQWRMRGSAIHVINPFSMHRADPWALPAHGFNPFDLLDPDGDTFAADAKVLAEIMTPRTGRESGSAKYFIDRAEAWIHASIIHIKTTEQPENRHAGLLYDHVHLDAQDWKRLLTIMKTNPVCGGLVRAAATDMHRMQEQAPEEFSAVLSTVQQSLQWLAEPKAREALTRSDVDFTVLKTNRKGAVIAVVLPLQYKETHAAISRLALQCAVWAMVRDPVSPHRVLFEIDEAASLGRIERLPQWLAELRKYKIQWSLYFQSTAQPKHLYQAEWQTFQGNTGLKRFIGVRDIETANEASAFCGQATIVIKNRGPGGSSLSETGRALRRPEEIIQLKSGEQLAVIENLPPLRLKITPYWNRPEFAGRYHRNPYVDRPKLMSPAVPLRFVWGRLVYGLAFVMTPHPVAACIITAALVFLLFRGQG
jgi:type IV secretion system protein VirD4